jgi:hypothetical protein
MVPGRIAARATILCVLAAAAVVPAAADGAPARSSVTVTRAVVAAKWKEGWLQPGAAVRLTGRVTAPTHVTAVLRPIGRKGIVTALADVDVARAGAFGAKVPLPPRPLPGEYRLHVTASGAQASKPADVVVKIPAPREGVVGAATASTSASGPWLRYENGAPTLSGPQRELWMRFPFLAPPKGKDVSIVWRLRWRVVVGIVHRAYDDTIETYARSATALPAGTWTVLLKVDGRVAKRMAVRLVGGPEPKTVSAAGITVG